MKEIVAKELAMNLMDATLHRDYSGRGMYGKETFAVELPELSIGEIAATWASCCVNDPDLNPNDIEGLAYDSLGMGVIIY